MVEPGEQISATLKKEFMEEALAGLDMRPEEREKLKRQVDGLFLEGTEVYDLHISFETKHGWQTILFVVRLLEFR